MILRRLFFIFNIIAIMSLLMQGEYSQSGQAASPIIAEGKFLIIWGDGVVGSGETRVAYYLSANQNNNIQLIISEDLLSSMGGSIRFNQKAVKVRGIWQNVGESIRVQTIALAKGEHAGLEGIYGPQPWVSILCKFSDKPDEPNSLNYFRQMYSSAYPGLDHFWRQNSYDLANLEGSNAYGWYTLPHDRAYYLPGGNFDWWAAAADCTGVADDDIEFAPYVGINLMFNYTLDCCAWGGGWYACLDGLCQVWRMTWEPPWGYQNIGVIAHETGHGFGLPHSLGNCQAGYDNRWDVLSDVWSNGSDPIWGTMGQHTISFDKEILEWITSEQLFTSTIGTLQTIRLERLAIPQTDNYLGARILINNRTDFFYTLEVRQPTANPIDYDKWLPGFAVIIHEVATNRSEPAIVIDQDGDCDTGDAGAMYTPHEVFKDIPNGITVSINSVTETGYVVTINNRFTIMDNVAVTGAEQGYIGERTPFTATINPEDATTPITFTWEATGLPPVQHVGDTTDSIEFIWDEPGTKVVTVTASNAGGTLVDTQFIDIVSPIPIVSLSGPTESNVGYESVFIATSVPTHVVQPITYTWQASGQLPITHTTGLSDTVSYTWDAPGTQVVTVTAYNIYGSTKDDIFFPIYMSPAYMEIAGPEVGDVNEDNIFTATVSPITTTVPISYIWTIDDQIIITHTAGLSDAAMLNWIQPGLHYISVSATNLVGTVVADWSITIYVRLFLPFSFRN